uniref:Uncharacterized protein MANES_05G076100 n=1 Tax=Rhizophora mucronata TaxID=61149 RepID=A0A2P2LGQ9_RHIMU
MGFSLSLSPSLLFCLQKRKGNKENYCCFFLNSNSMLPLLCLPNLNSKSFVFLTQSVVSFPGLKSTQSHRTHHFTVHSIQGKHYQQQRREEQSTNQRLPSQQSPRTLFPGGFKRPEIKVPSVALQLSPDEVLAGPDALDFVDKAVSKWVGIVVLDGGDGSGKRLYDAACFLKSVVRDRAFFLIAERVDIASAVNASGVSLSDQGLPVIVARNMMMDTRPELVVLPLVARNVQTPNAALNASKSEGADFLIYNLSRGKNFDQGMNFGFEEIKVPIFIKCATNKEAWSFMEASKFVSAGASGLVMSLEDLRLFSDDALHHLFNSGDSENPNNVKVLDVENDNHQAKRVAGFIKLEDREKQLIETERSVLLEAINVFQKAAPMMEEASLLIDATSRIDEPFLLAIVVIVC